MFTIEDVNEIEKYIEKSNMLLDKNEKLSKNISKHLLYLNIISILALLLLNSELRFFILLAPIGAMCLFIIFKLRVKYYAKEVSCETMMKENMIELLYKK